MRDKLKITFRQRGKLRVIDLDGDLTAAAAEPLEQAYELAIAEPDAMAVLNLQRCDYVTSSGFAVVASIALRAHRDKRRLCIVGMNPHQAKVAALLGIQAFAEIHSSLDEITG
jgi:anti-anti-sigma factor